jgi:putative tryptophan/tyrosine transport system substrate-binding protein
MRRHPAAWPAIILGVALLAATAAPAPAQTKVPRIGVLSPLDPGATWFSEGLRAGLADHGYVEGKTIQIEFRWAHGDFARLPALAAELVRLDVDLIVAGVTQASLAARTATRTIPIVMVGVGDPVAVGLVDTLARPGGNVTGTSTVAIDVVGKQFELLRELDPRLSRIGVLWNPTNSAFQSLQVRQAEHAAQASGVTLKFVETTESRDFEDAAQALRRDEIRAALILADPLFTIHRQVLADVLARGPLIAVSGSREFAEAGGLMAYGASYTHTSRRAAVFVDRILKGARPAEMPVEQSDRFELVVNLRTARLLGVDIPPTLLARADEVIE